jgi:hypothetical protein
LLTLFFINFAALLPGNCANGAAGPTTASG